MRVFISYTRTKDTFGAVNTFYAHLLNELRMRDPAADVFLDTKNLIPGDHFPDELEKQLQLSDVLIVLLSPAWLKSSWCRRELLSFTNQLADSGKSRRIVPVLWIDTPEVITGSSDPIAALLANINRVDWRALRHNNSNSPEYCACLDELATNLTTLCAGTATNPVQQANNPVQRKTLSPQYETNADDLLPQLESQHSYSRIEQDRFVRRKGLQSLDRKLQGIAIRSKRLLDLHFAVLFDMFRDAHTLAEYKLAATAIQRFFTGALKASIPEGNRRHAARLFAEWSVDFAQSAPNGIELSQMAQSLREAVKLLSDAIGPSAEKNHAGDALADLLACRAKCRRALASVLQRRTLANKKTLEHVRKLRKEGLTDSTRAITLSSSDHIKLELALCLFANSSDQTVPTAERGLALLSEVASSGRLLVAGYELARQLRVRHLFSQAAEVFLPLHTKEPDRRRFYRNLGVLVAAIRGIYYEERPSADWRSSAQLAEMWLTEAVTFASYQARDLVDLAFVRAVCGHSTKDIVAPIAKLEADAKSVFDDLSQHPGDPTKSVTLHDALLLGMGDAAVWSLIGTIYADFCEDYEKAKTYYSRASWLDPRSPVYHFNMANLLARRLDVLPESELHLNKAKILLRNNRSWATANRNRIEELSQFLKRSH